jgi:hypothetical protein
LNPLRRRRCFDRPTRLALLTVAVAACRAEAPAPEPPPREPTPAAADSFDPQAPGLSDLARLSRYVFREMGRGAARCAPEPVPSGRIGYTLEIEVASGRIASARLATVTAELGGFTAPLLPERWPRELVASVECLEPHLRAISMSTPPADGVYASRFALGGSHAGRDEATPPPPPPPPQAQALPDPAEPGLPDLQRIARHVFVEMHRVAGECALRNPLAERLGYVVEVEVRGGAIARAEVIEARVELETGNSPLLRDAWPEALDRYAACLVPHLEGLVLEPAPADGVYRPDYAVQPEP